MANWLTPPQNPVVVGQSGHLTDHDSIATDLAILQAAAMAGFPTGALQQSLPRNAVTSATVPIGATTGTVYMAAMWLPAGVTVSNVSWITGSTAAGTPTHWWLGLANSAGMQAAHSTDQTTGAIAANTLITKAMVTPYTTTANGIHYALISVTATTNPTSTGVAAPTNMGLTSPLLAGVSASTQSTPGTDGTTTYTLPTTAGGVAYAYLT